jgi:hypothetical protein
MCQAARPKTRRAQRSGPLISLASAAISPRRLVTRALANAFPIDPNSMLRELHLICDN